MWSPSSWFVAFETRNPVVSTPVLHEWKELSCIPLAIDTVDHKRQKHIVKSKTNKRSVTSSNSSRRSAIDSPVSEPRSCSEQSSWIATDVICCATYTTRDAPTATETKRDIMPGSAKTEKKTIQFPPESSLSSFLKLSPVLRNEGGAATPTPQTPKVVDV